MSTRIISLLIISLIFSGCVSVTTGLQLAQFGVKVGFDIHDYADRKREEVKGLVDDNRTK